MKTQMNAPIIHEYNGVPITYGEGRNIWKFELRGRDRSADSLAACKLAIDKPVPESKKQFTRIPVFFKEYSASKFQRGEITSIAEPSRYGGGQQVWLTIDGNRQKVSASDCYPITPENEALEMKYAEPIKQIESLQAKRDGIRLTHAAIEPETP